MRFCTNCGERLNDQQAFCPNCGNPVAPTAVKTVPITFEPSTDRKPKKRKTNRTLLIVLICVAAALIVGVLLAGFFLLGWFKSPHARLQTYLDNGSKLVSDAILAQETEDGFSTDGSLSLDLADVTLPSEADYMVYEMFGMDLTTLLKALSVDLNMDLDPNKGNALIETALNLSGSTLGGYTFTADDVGLGVYASSSQDYAVAPWEGMGLSSPFSSPVDKEDVAALVLEISEAAKELLTEDSVTLERGYTLTCGDGEDLRCKMYVIRPDKREWEDFLGQLIDAVASNDATSGIMTQYADSQYTTVDDLTEMLHRNVESISASLEDADVTMELYVNGMLPAGFSVSMQSSESDTSAELAFTSHGNGSSGFRGVTLEAVMYDDPILTFALENTYKNAGSNEAGSVEAEFVYEDRSTTITLDGEYEGSSFDLDVAFKQSDNSYSVTVSNDCDKTDDSCSGVFSAAVSAPYETGKLGFSVEYDFSLKEASILRIPYGSYSLSVELQNVLYDMDQALSDTRLTLTVAGESGGGSEHRLTVSGLNIYDTLRIGEASIVFTTSDEDSTARKPSVTPRQVSSYELGEVITGALPAFLQ